MTLQSIQPIKGNPTMAIREVSAEHDTDTLVAAQRMLIYLRVSTDKQARVDLSIPDQRRQIEAWAAARGYVIVGVFVEPGASATDDRRPEFQRMIDRACNGDNTADAIVVHSFSRFMRESLCSRCTSARSASTASS